MYWISQDSPERYEKPRIVFLIVCIWYDIKNIYLKDVNMFVLRQLHNKINTTVVSMSIICLMLFMTITILSSALSLNNMNDGLNRHFEEVYKRQNVA